MKGITEVDEEANRDGNKGEQEKMRYPHQWLSTYMAYLMVLLVGLRLFNRVDWNAWGLTYIHRLSSFKDVDGFLSPLSLRFCMIALDLHLVKTGVKNLSVVATFVT